MISNPASLTQARLAGLFSFQASLRRPIRQDGFFAMFAPPILKAYPRAKDVSRPARAGKRGLLYLRQIVKIGLQFGVGGNIIVHFAVMELLIGDHVEISRAGQAEHNGFRLSGLLAL